MTNYFQQAATRPKYPPTQLALGHFDATYGGQMGELWPSIRVALLSERKYGALVNNFCHDAVQDDLQAMGCRDFIDDADTEGKYAFVRIKVHLYSVFIYFSEHDFI